MKKLLILCVLIHLVGCEPTQEDYLAEFCKDESFSNIYPDECDNSTIK